MTVLGVLPVWFYLAERPQTPGAALPEPLSVARRPMSGGSHGGVSDAEYSRIVLARPLFDPTRRPAAIRGTPVEQADVADALPRLSGTIIGVDGYRAAILVPADGGHAVTVREGDRSSGLRVLQILPGEIMAETGNGRFSLSISFDRGPLATPPPAPLVKPVRVPLGFAVAKPDPRERGPGDQDE